MSQAKELYGWWLLVSLHLESQGSDERAQPFGAHPFGRLVLSPDGQMMAVITAEGRKAGQSDTDQVALFNSMLAYTGNYTISGDKFITKVAASWNEAWTGTDQERVFKLDGDRLDIVSAWGPHPFIPSSPPIRGILSWQREA